MIYFPLFFGTYPSSDFSPQTRVFRKCSIDDLMQFAPITNGLHFLLSISLHLRLKHPCSPLPREADSWHFLTEA